MAERAAGSAKREKKIAIVSFFLILPDFYFKSK